jgi:hypothetical protein
MDRVARLPARERSALFSETAARMGAAPAVAEKDFWVTWVLDRLFRDADLRRLLKESFFPEFVSILLLIHRAVDQTQ